jgi:hypothetical protein
VLKAKTTVSSLLISFLTLSAQADAEREFNVDEFDSVKVSQGITLNLVMGISPSVNAMAANDRDLDRLEIEVEDGVLEIRRGSWVAGFFSMGQSHGSVTVNVVASELEALVSSSGANADLTGIACDDLTLDASSGSRIEASGRCDTVVIDASSGAVVDSRDLMTAEALVDSSSGASIKVFAGESFRGDASSGSSVRVYGTPEMAESTTSSGARIDMRGHEQTI